MSDDCAHCHHPYDEHENGCECGHGYCDCAEYEEEGAEEESE